VFDSTQREAGGGIIETPDCVNGNCFGNRKHDHDQRRAAEKSPGEVDGVLRHRNQL
jgi:hypothetical protein